MKRVLRLATNWLSRFSGLCLLLSGAYAAANGLPSSSRAQKAIASVESQLQLALADKGLKYGAPVFIRIFKAEQILEVWLENDNRRFEHFRNYPVCNYSGDLGPKIKQGDKQSPEGFYFVSGNRLNPWSQFHLSFNLGYPNAFDRHHGRTGDYLMVHGSCVSVGCYAMTDAGINEIYALAHAALSHGQDYFRVHAFPFKMTTEAMEQYRGHQWYGFWQNLQQGYDWFEQHQRPPDVKVINGDYQFQQSEY